MTKDEKDFLRKAIKDGKLYTTAIHTIGPLGYQAIKEVVIPNMVQIGRW